jgi:hypothetical protein
MEIGKLTMENYSERFARCQDVSRASPTAARLRSRARLAILAQILFPRFCNARLKLDGDN